MSLPRQVYLSGISTELGALCPATAILEEGDTAETAALLGDKGVETFSRLEPPLSSIVARCISATLCASGLEAREIDSIVLATESFAQLVETPVLRGDTPVWTARNALFKVFADMGIDRAPVFCSSFGGSSNLLQAVYLAHPLVVTGRSHKVLVVCVDCHPPGVSRFMQDAIALTGDGVASFVLSAQPRGSHYYELDHVGIAPYLRAVANESLSQKMLEMYRATKSAAADCYDATQRQPEEFDWLILANYNHVTSKIFSQLLRFPLERTWLHNVARTGHVPACDGLINLNGLEQAGHMSPGSSVMMFINGPISCGTISLLRAEAAI